MVVEKLRMRRLGFFALFAALGFSALNAQDASAPANPSAFEGAWLGEIAAPNTRTEFGLAFTRAGEELLVSVYFPEMFLYSANFGPASFRDGAFTLDALNLTLKREGDTLAGTFAIGQLPVRLRRASAFASEPAAPDYPAAPTPAWSLDLGAPAWASPVTRDGILYVGTTDGKFHAVRSADGTRVWTWEGKTPLYGTALATDEHLFFVDDRNDLVALVRASGALAWRLPLHDPAFAPGGVPHNETFNHRAASPVVDDKGVLYVGSTDGGVYAVRARTGKKVSRFDAKSRVYAPVAIRGEQLIVATFDGILLVVNRRTNKEISRTKLGGGLVSAPVVAGRHIVVGARDYFLYGFDASATKVTWKNSFWFSWVESTPRFFDGLLYVGGSDFRRVSAIEPETGRVRWATDVGGLSWGTPVVNEEVVYAATAGQTIEGTVIQHRGGIVALDRATGTVRWRYARAAQAGNDFAGFAGSLLLAGDKVVGASVDGALIAFPVTSASKP